MVELVTTVDTLLVKMLVNFFILETNTLFSDIHNPLSLTVKAEVVKNKVVVDEPSHEKIKDWESTKTADFIDSIDGEKVNEILTQLVNMVDNATINETTINTAVESISNLLTDAAKSTFGTYTQQKLNPNLQKYKKASKPWFDDDCKEARKKYKSSKES
ncbi:unnamed protein product [Mytilus edulis]|uniref:Uncharacterized protein n=1 Tax=Mytilus edulis TaxID=6550 RepID=A0A8S3R9C3_MYTED|nr:unnamed protein product [Mytilus edulis]